MAKNILSDGEKSQRKRAGRSFLIEDGQLANSRDHLVWLLGNSWGIVGWELQRIKTAADVHKALEIWNQPHESNYAVVTLLRPSEIPATAQELRAIRRELGKMNESEPQANTIKEECRQTLETVERALLSEPSNQQLHRERDKRAKALVQAEDELERIKNQQQKLFKELQGVETYFARHELACFCTSRRYRITPLYAANAMAGLPFIGWRQSLKRCSRVGCPLAGSLNYEIFRVLSRIVKSCPNYKHLTAHAEHWLRSKRMPSYHAISQMQKKWYYLRRAIQDALENRPLRSSRLPFLILAEYQQKTTHPSFADDALEEEERIMQRFRGKHPNAVC